MDSTISDADGTVNLDDSDWTPPDMSDDDSIEIVGEISQRRTRTTRSRAMPAAPNPYTTKEQNFSPHHDKKAKKQAVERGRHAVRQQRDGSRSKSHTRPHPYQCDQQSPSSPMSGSSTSPQEDQITPSVGQKRKLNEDWDNKEPTPVKKGKKRNSLSRLPKKGTRMASLRTTRGPPLGGCVDTDKLNRRMITNTTSAASKMQSPKVSKKQDSWLSNAQNISDSDLFELDLPDLDVPSSMTQLNQSSNSPKQKVSSVPSLTKSSVNIDSEPVGNSSITKTVDILSPIKSERDTNDIEIISATTSTPSIANKPVKTEARINHRIARLFGEDAVDPPVKNPSPLRLDSLNRPSVVSSNRSGSRVPPNKLAPKPMPVSRGHPERILNDTRSPHVPQASSKIKLLQDSSVCSVKSEKVDLDLSSSFEFSPKSSIKKRLTMPKKVIKRSSLTGPCRKSKSPAVAKSKALLAAAIKSKTTTKNIKSLDPDLDVLFEWDPAQVISERQGVSESQARQVISLFEKECTLPFIARYRRENTGNMQIEKLREVQNAFEQLKEVKQKVAKLIKEDLKKNEVSPDTRASLLNATSIQEVKTLTASLKSSKGKRTFADRARQLGLTEAADALLNDPSAASTQRWSLDLVNPRQEGRSNLEQVETGLKYIVADVISKDPKLLAFMKAGLKQSNIPFISSKARKIVSQEKVTKPKKVIAKRKSLGGQRPSLKKTATSCVVAPAVVAKYEKYFDFSMSAWRVMPHVVCAINRGEQQGVLSVKVVPPPFVLTQFMRYCTERWLASPNQGHQGPGGHVSAPYRRKLLLDTLQDCYDRLVSPSLQSWVRSELNDSAELASIEVFATNLRSLLLTPPVKVNTVLAIDPGFMHGCKVAVVERKGKVLAVDTIFPFGGRHQVDDAVFKFRQLVVEYRCEVVCIGNGTACREAETWLSELIQRGVFANVNVQYTIIDESGASQYSVTPEAKEEFPDLDINHISAVSLARRLQDPLLEYVKVPPMHLGVGMYQHDVASKLLQTSLDSVVMECVSFVGVDLNVASEIILRKVSGLNKARAAAIVKHRDDCGAFRSREDLKKVKGIGPVSFQQCAGFVRIVPQTLRQRSSNSSLTALCPLDSTTVHPESYDIAKKLMALADVNTKDIGTAAFITALRTSMHSFPPKELCTKMNCSEVTLHGILESLYQPLDHDFRGQFDQPLFRKGVTRLEDLRLGDHMTGSVRNVTPFGAFIDIGVGNSGLLHNRYMNGQVLQLGNTVIVQIMNVEVAKGRISLKLIQVTR